MIATSGPDPSAVTPAWVALDDLARAYAEAARAPATLRAYAADWGAFRTWCAQHAVDALPANPHTLSLSLFLADLPCRPATLRRKLAAIAVMHRSAGEQRPAIVMAHGFGAVKEAYLDDYAARFCAAGFVVTVFDYRSFGASEGQPRSRVNPPAQIDDYRNAISWTQSRPEVDPEQTGVWGSSFSGGHAIFLAQVDRRVKAAVAQVPFISGFATTRRLQPLEAIAETQAQFGAERLARYQTGAAPAHFPVFAPPGEPALFPTPDAYAFWENSKDRATCAATGVLGRIWFTRMSANCACPPDHGASFTSACQPTRDAHEAPFPRKLHREWRKARAGSTTSKLGWWQAAR